MGCVHLLPVLTCNVGYNYVHFNALHRHKKYFWWLHDLILISSLSNVESKHAGREIFVRKYNKRSL
jgi:hypothetical protein